MSESGALPRMPMPIRAGNGISVTYGGGAYTVGVVPETLMVTPTDGAPVPLGDTLAALIANNTAGRNITVVDDGYFDVPGTGNRVLIDDGWF